MLIKSKMTNSWKREFVIYTSSDLTPLEVIQQRPGKVTLDGDGVQLDRFQYLVGVVLVVVNSQEIIKIAELALDYIGIN